MKLYLVLVFVTLIDLFIKYKNYSTEKIKKAFLNISDENIIYKEFKFYQHKKHRITVGPQLEKGKNSIENY